MSDRKKVKLNVRVPPEKKEEWRDALEEGETLTTLVRRAVYRDIRDEYVHESELGAYGGVESDGVELAEQMHQKAMEEVENRTEALQNQIDEMMVSEGYSQEHVESTAMDAYKELLEAPEPPAEAESTVDTLDLRLKKAQEQLLSTAEVAEKKDIGGSVEKVAEALDAPEPLVREALIYLEKRSTLSVESVVVDGTRHWMTL